ncbi:MAG: hypothetical protein Q8Q24_00905 [bacterium]|nr:hypothetical protein [bacterium]
MQKLKSEIVSRFLIAFLWLGFISVARWSWHPSLIFLWLGGFLGIFLLDIDHLFYTLLVHPQELTSVRVRRFIDLKNYKEALLLLFQTRQERQKLNFHNAFFQVFFYVFAFFVLTSSGSLLGAGLVLGILLHLLYEEITNYLGKREELLRDWLFWPIGGKISLRGQKIFLAVSFLVFFWLNLLLI